MKKQFTLAALGLLTAGAFSAQAQITVDGKVMATEIGTGSGKYELAGTYTGTHSVADKGLQSLYLATTPTKLHIALVGSSESTDYPGFVVYLNVPGKTGVAAGTKLAGGKEGTSPLKHTPTMDMEVDYGFRATTAPVANDNVYYSFADYTAGSAAPVADTYQGNSAKAGVAITGAATDGPFKGARYAYVSSATLAAAIAAGSGLEVEIDLEAMGLKTGDKVDLMAAYVKDGGVFTSDVLPMVAGQTADLGSSPDFTTLAGKQFLTYQIGTGVLANQSAVARALKFGVYPNPAAGSATVSYEVSGQQQVTVDVFNALGQRVRSVASGLQTGVQKHPFSDLASGAYFVKLQVGGQSTSQKLIEQ